MNTNNQAVAPSPKLSRQRALGKRLGRNALLAMLATLVYGGTAPAATVFDYRFDGGTLGAAIPTLVDSGPNGFNGTITGAV